MLATANAHTQGLAGSNFGPVLFGGAVEILGSRARYSVLVLGTESTRKNTTRFSVDRHFLRPAFVSSEHHLRTQAKQSAAMSFEALCHGIMMADLRAACPGGPAQGLSAGRCKKVSVDRKSTKLRELNSSAAQLRPARDSRLLPASLDFSIASFAECDGRGSLQSAARDSGAQRSLCLPTPAPVTK